MLLAHSRTKVFLLSSTLSFSPVAWAQQSETYNTVASASASALAEAIPSSGYAVTQNDSDIERAANVVNVVQSAVGVGRTSICKKSKQPSTSCPSAPAAAQPIIVNVPVKPEEDAWKPATVVTLILSLLSLGLTLGNIGYTVFKDRRARRHSVIDDYWFRKVVGPLTVEPMLASIQELMAATPDNRGADGFKVAKIKKFHDTWVKKLATCAADMSSLNLLEQGLGPKVAEIIDDIQELVINYFSAQLPTGTVIQKGDFQQSVNAKWVLIMQSIRDAQSKLK